MRMIVLAVAIVVVLYLSLVATTWALQERVVWQPPPQRATPPREARRIDYASGDGAPLYAYVVGDPAHAPGLLIAFHGNAELAAWNVPWATDVARRTGWAVLLPEYRGYGGSGGTPGYEASRTDARATYAMAREQAGGASVPIAYYGHSLGTAIAADLAADHPPSALVLSAPFTSARDMAAGLRILPFGVFWRVLGRVHWDTRARVAALDVPVSVVHGTIDGVVPTRMGREVHAAARRKGQLLLVRGAGHNDIEAVAGDAYWAWIAHALASR